MRGFKPSRRQFVQGTIIAALAGCKHWDDHWYEFKYGVNSKNTLTVPPIVSEPTDAVQNFYGIAVGDLVEIKFPYRADLSETVSVREDGMIALPLIDPIMAVGKNPELLQAEVQNAYSSLAYDPTEKYDPKKPKQYIISVGDILEIKFDNYPQYNDTVTVRPDGKISLGLVRTILAEGRTPEQLENELRDRYGASLKSPQLVVIVRQATNEKFYVNGVPTRPGLRGVDGVSLIVRTVAPRLIYVGGEVNKPGFIAYQHPMTAMQAIISCGGHMRTGKLRETIVVRRLNTPEPVVMCLNLKQDYVGMSGNDIALKPFDIVIVPKTKIAKVSNFIQQYIYDIFPMAKQNTFTILYSVTSGRTTTVPVVQGGAAAGS